jgi:hypothetical protein
MLETIDVVGWLLYENCPWLVDCSSVSAQQNDLLQQSAFGLSSSYGGTISSALKWLDVIDPTHVGVSTRVSSSHVLPIFAALVVLLVILALSRLVCACTCVLAAAL